MSPKGTGPWKHLKYDLSPQAIATRVSYGADRFDGLKPDWWSAENIDIEALDESHPRYSVAGQNRKHELGWDGTWDRTLSDFTFGSALDAALEGFYFTVDQDGFSRAEWDTKLENELLTMAWKKEILTRRARRK